ncbi:MAG TPA: hypothetical protein VHR66_00640 [Gemmataceae bacterium]|jgi:hypothetical protein|nr:hypothetical protein [Gemmataceae bacterium]
MQIQPYNAKDLIAAAGSDRIPVPSGPGQALVPASTQPPTLVQVFVREVWKRKRLLAIWGIITAVVTGFVVTTIAKPVYRAEGRLSYRPNYGAGGSRPIYTPPNIQSAVQILKANDVFEPVRVKHVPGMSPDEFGRNIHIELSRQSEFVDVSFDHPSPVIAAAVANDLMTEGLKFFADVRVKSTKDAVVQVNRDFEQAKKDLERAKTDYAEAFRAHKIENPEVELDNYKSALADIGSKLLDAQTRLAVLPAEIQFQETLRDAPPNASDAVLDEQLLSKLQALQFNNQQRMFDERTLEDARINLKAAREQELKWRPLVAKGVMPQSEFDNHMTKIHVLEATVKQGEAYKKERESIQKTYDDLKNQMKSGKPIRTNVLQKIETLKQEQATLPGKIKALQLVEGQKKKELGDLTHLMAEIGPKNEAILMARTQMQDLSAQLTSVAGRSQDPYANDLRVHAPAIAGTTPYTTNAPKLGLAIVGVSALLFVGYIGLFCLPKGSFTTPGVIAGIGSTKGGLLPRALVALVPVSSKATAAGQPALNGSAADAMTPAAPAPSPANAMESTLPMAEPVNDAEAVAVAEPEPVRALAERIASEGVDRGGIVLFSPTEEELQLTPAMGDLGRYFTERGERVLVFDARTAAENPSWVQAPGVAASVEGFLNGETTQAAGCFVPTELQGVEYSRVDLSHQLSGVVEAKRFQNLVEEMRERYSVVFLVGPPVTLEEDHPLLATLAQGMVLVTETAANPVEVHAYLDTLCQQVPARLYGTLAVPKTAA